MRNRVRGMLVGVVVMGLASPVAAQALTASGTIVSIDAQQQRMAIRTGVLGGLFGLFTTKEFEVAPNAEITAGQQPLQLEQLQRGQEATVAYSEADGKRIAQSIMVKPEDVEQAAGEPEISPQGEPAAPADEQAAPAGAPPAEEESPTSPQSSEELEPSGVPSPEEEQRLY